MDSYPLQLIRFGHSLGGNQVKPLVVPFFGKGEQDFSSDVSRGDAVDSAVVNPLDRQALGELDNSCLRRIVLYEDEQHKEGLFSIENIPPLASVED